MAPPFDRGPSDRGPSVRGPHLRGTGEADVEIAALAGRVGGAAGLDGLLGDLNRQARPSRGVPGRAVADAWTWNRQDRGDARWWPQGVSTSADAAEAEVFAGRRLLVTTWYRRGADGSNQGSRVTFVDLDTLRYRHVLLVVPRLVAGALRLDPLRVHAGGIVWRGRHLHVAATWRGLVTCRLDDVLRMPGGASDSDRLATPPAGISSMGYRYVLPVRLAHEAGTDDGHPRLRYSFLSLDRSPSGPPSGPHLVVGEYAAHGEPTRLVRFPLDPSSGLPVAAEDGLTRPVGVDEVGLQHMQGAVVVGGRWYVTASAGPALLGSVHTGRPGAFRRHPHATPMGPEDLSYWPGSDTLWSLSEHPHRRWVFAMRRSWFDDHEDSTR